MPVKELVVVSTSNARGGCRANYNSARESRKGAISNALERGSFSASAAARAGVVTQGGTVTQGGVVTMATAAMLDTYREERLFERRPKALDIGSRNVIDIHNSAMRPASSSALRDHRGLVAVAHRGAGAGRPDVRHLEKGLAARR